MNRQEKEEFITSLRSDLEKASVVVVTQQSGMTVGESQDLRSKLRSEGGAYRVVKNTLARLAIAGTRHESLTEHLKGPTALAFSEDPVAAAKVSVNFSNDNGKLSIVCGMLDEKFLDEAAVKTLAKLPSLDELRGKIIGVIQAPATKVAGVLQAPAGQLARVFSAYGSQN